MPRVNCGAPCKNGPFYFIAGLFCLYSRRVAKTEEALHENGRTDILEVLFMKLNSDRLFIGSFMVFIIMINLLTRKCVSKLFVNAREPLMTTVSQNLNFKMSD